MGPLGAGVIHLVVEESLIFLKQIIKSVPLTLLCFADFDDQQIALCTSVSATSLTSFWWNESFIDAIDPPQTEILGMPVR